MELFTAWIMTIGILTRVLSINGQSFCRFEDYNACKCDVADGSGFIDISTIGNADGTARFANLTTDEDNTMYSYNPCIPFNSPDGSLSGLAAMLQSGENYSDLGIQQNAYFTQNENSEFSISYTAKDTDESSSVILKCNQSLEEDVATAQGVDASTGIYQFTLEGPSACPRKNSVCKVTDHDPCKCDLKDGSGRIDLTGIGNQDGSPRFKDLRSGQDPTLYYYNPCHGFVSSDGVFGLAVLMNSGGVVKDIGAQIFSQFTYNKDGYLSILYQSYDYQIFSQVLLICSNSDLTMDAAGPDGSTGIYGFTLKGSDVCRIKEQTLSGGSIFLIIFFMLLFVYLAVGILYNLTAGKARGTDVIPNKTFWVSLPGLMRDGLMFFVFKCKGNPAPINYDQIE